MSDDAAQVFVSLCVLKLGLRLAVSEDERSTMKRKVKLCKGVHIPATQTQQTG